MARYYGDIGFGLSTEIPPGSGVWEDTIELRQYYGDVVRNTRKLESGTGVNDNVTVANSISIVADTYAIEHFFAIKYISWLGGLWTVTSVDVQTPRLILNLGSVYNGPTP